MAFPPARSKRHHLLGVLARNALYVARIARAARTSSIAVAGSSIIPVRSRGRLTFTMPSPEAPVRVDAILPSTMDLHPSQATLVWGVSAARRDGGGTITLEKAGHSNGAVVKGRWEGMVAATW